MAYFYYDATGTTYHPGVDVLRRNTSALTSSESVNFTQQGTFFWRINNPLIGEQFGALNDVSVVKYSDTAGIITDVTDIHGISLYQVGLDLFSRPFLYPLTTSSSSIDQVLSSQFPTFNNTSRFEKLIVSAGRSDLNYLPEFYLGVTGDAGNFDEVFGDLGINAPHDGRALIVRGTLAGQRDAAWGNWLDVINVVSNQPPDPNPDPGNPILDPGNPILDPGNPILDPGNPILDPGNPKFIPPDTLLPVPDATNPHHLVSRSIEYLTNAAGELRFTEQNRQTFKDVSSEFLINLENSVTSFVIKKVALTALEAAFGPVGWVIAAKQAWDVYSVTKPLIEVYGQAFLHDLGLVARGPTNAEIFSSWSQSVINLGLSGTNMSGGVLSANAKDWVAEAALTTFNAGLYSERNSFTYTMFTPDDSIPGVAVQGGDKRDLAFGSMFQDDIDGGDGNDRLFGFDGNDILRGGAGNDILSGGSGSDTLYGGDGNDRLLGFDGEDLAGAINTTDLLSGGNGFDTVVYSGARSEFSIVNGFLPGRIIPGEARGLKEVISGDFVHDMVLMDVERLQFSDGTLAFDNQRTDSAGKGYLLYRAAFDRAPDLAGLGHWINRLDAGADYSRELAVAFIGSPEFVLTYGSNVSNAQFINLLYQNVLDRAPDPGGNAHWQNLLNNGYTRPDVLTLFALSDENYNAVRPQINDGIFFV